MMRLITFLILLGLLMYGAYHLIKLHAKLIIKWKNELEYIEINGTEHYGDDENLHDLLMLIGFTLVPVVADSLIVLILYSLFKDLIT